MGVTKFVARDDAGASKPTETRVCRTSRQSRHHNEVSFRPCSILGRSLGARCHAHSGLSALSSVLMYYVDRVGPNIVSAIRNREVAAIRNVLLYYDNGVSIRTARWWPH